jgi:hypothetical protein
MGNWRLRFHKKNVLSLKMARQTCFGNLSSDFYRFFLVVYTIVI